MQREQNTYQTESSNSYKPSMPTKILPTLPGVNIRRLAKIHKFVLKKSTTIGNHNKTGLGAPTQHHFHKSTSIYRENNHLLGYYFSQYDPGS